jgi:hypothetical protein
MGLKRKSFYVINVLDKTHSITKKIEYKNNQVMKQMNFFRGAQILVLPRAPDCLKTALYLKMEVYFTFGKMKVECKLFQ